MKIMFLILLIGFIGFVLDLIVSGPQSKSEREYNMLNGRIQK